MNKRLSALNLATGLPPPERIDARSDGKAEDRAGSRMGTLAALRSRIRALEGWGTDGAAGILPFDLVEIDAALPGGGLPLACLHEILPADPAHDGAATGFAAVLATRLAILTGETPVLWLSRARDLYPPGLAAFGLTPSRLLIGRATSRVDLLWALEEAARSATLAAVIGEGAAPGLSESRRLQLAAEAGGVTLVLLGRATTGTTGSMTATSGSTTAVTRWRIAAAPGSTTHGRTDPTESGVGKTAWQVELVRCRGGRPGRWTVLSNGPDGTLALSDRKLTDRKRSDSDGDMGGGAIAAVSQVA